MPYSINHEDISQITIGAFALAVPISFSEEAWKLGESLPLLNLSLVLFLSLGFLTVYAYYSVFQSNIRFRFLAFVLRIFIAYFIALAVVALVLTALDKFPLLSEPLLALRRAIVISMPASMGAIVVDSFDKE